MNRFSNYLNDQKMAKALHQSASDALKKGDTSRAMHFLIESHRYQMTACNNIASLYFERRKKR